MRISYKTRLCFTTLILWRAVKWDYKEQPPWRTTAKWEDGGRQSFAIANVIKLSEKVVRYFHKQILLQVEKSLPGLYNLATCSICQYILKIILSRLVFGCLLSWANQKRVVINFMQKAGVSLLSQIILYGNIHNLQIERWNICWSDPHKLCSSFIIICK